MRSHFYASVSCVYGFLNLQALPCLCLSFKRILWGFVREKSLEINFLFVWFVLIGFGKREECLNFKRLRDSYLWTERSDYVKWSGKTTHWTPKLFQFKVRTFRKLQLKLTTAWKEFAGWKFVPIKFSFSKMKGKKIDEKGWKCGFPAEWWADCFCLCCRSKCTKRCLQKIISKLMYQEK